MNARWRRNFWQRTLKARFANHALPKGRASDTIGLRGPSEVLQRPEEIENRHHPNAPLRIQPQQL